MLFRVEDLVGDATLLHHPCQHLGLLDRDGADQHWLTLLVSALDVVETSPELGVLGLVYEVALVLANQRTVGGHGHNVKSVGAHELGGFGLGGAGHAGEPLIEAVIVLQGDGGEGLVFFLDRHAFLGLDRLVKAIGPAPAVEHPAGELVDDLHFAVGDDVFLVTEVELLGPERRLQLMHQVGRHLVVEILDPERSLHCMDAVFERRNRALFLVDLIVDISLQATSNARKLAVELGGIGHPT